MYQFNNAYNPYVPQPQRQPQTNLDWIMVQNINQVDSVALQPNSKAWIMVQNEPIFALRTSDQMGLITTEYYRFEKYEPNTATTYVTASQLEDALAKLKGEINESIIQTAPGRGSKSSRDKILDADS